MASEEVADLVRKAWQSIVDDPLSWDQGAWIDADNEACKTTFCLGGWMMVHEGLQIRADPSAPEYPWFEDKPGRMVDPDSYVNKWVSDIHGPGHRGSSIFNGDHDTLPKLKSAIEAAGIILDPIPQRAETDWDIQFDSDIEFFVKLCVEAGDRITVRQVRSDDILMGLLRTIRRNGRREGKAEVPANAGVLEAQHLLKLEQRHSEKLREQIADHGTILSEQARRYDDTLKALRKENDELRRAASGTPKVRFDTLQQALRERTKQAREAGAAAREARAQVAVRDEAIDRLTALLEHRDANAHVRAELAGVQQRLDLMHVRMRRIHDLSNPGGN